MIHGLIAVLIVIVVDRVLAIMTYKELERRLTEDIDMLWQYCHKSFARIEEIENSLGNFQIKQRQDFDWTQGELAGVPERFASFEKQITNEHTRFDMYIMALHGRIDELEKKLPKNKKGSK